ncbi:hypothetical protein Tco_1080388 [Tanacetum coccineum]|uniref:Uncharacterized protein n=1 Tax=Tanacetum coccineum TaxID=301880 RepID=A0ABQ5HUK0_9ASTR
MEYLVKISKKARILELKRRYLKITVLTSVSIKEDTTSLCLHFTKYHEGNKINTPYPGKTNTSYSSYGNKIFWKISIACMTRSSIKELFTPFKEPEREFRSSRKLLKTLILDESRSSEFNLFSDLEEYSKEEVAKTMAKTIE